jgi:L,D-transpeptidase ErfK/SrfK
LRSSLVFFHPTCVRESRAFDRRLKTGQQLRVNNRHIVSPGWADGLLINLLQHLLFYFVQGQLVTHYSVRLGRPDCPTLIGAFVLILDWSQSGGVGIHSTIAPVSIYQFRSHWCIRLHPDGIANLFARMSIGPWYHHDVPMLLARVADNQVYLEVHRDVHKRGGDPRTAVQRLTISWGLDRYWTGRGSRRSFA